MFFCVYCVGRRRREGADEGKGRVGMSVVEDGGSGETEGGGSDALDGSVVFL